MNHWYTALNDILEAFLSATAPVALVLVIWYTLIIVDVMLISTYMVYLLYTKRKLILERITAFKGGNGMKSLIILLLALLSFVVSPAISQANLWEPKQFISDPGLPSDVAEQLMKSCECPIYDGTLHMENGNLTIRSAEKGKLIIFNRKYLLENCEIERECLKALRLLEAMPVEFKIVGDPSVPGTSFISFAFVEGEDAILFENVMIQVLKE